MRFQSVCCVDQLNQIADSFHLTWIGDLTQHLLRGQLWFLSPGGLKFDFRLFSILTLSEGSANGSYSVGRENTQSTIARLVILSVSVRPAVHSTTSTHHPTLHKCL